MHVKARKLLASEKLLIKIIHGNTSNIFPAVHWDQNRPQPKSTYCKCASDLKRELCCKCKYRAAFTKGKNVCPTSFNISEYFSNKEKTCTSFPVICYSRWRVCVKHNRVQHIFMMQKYVLCLSCKVENLTVDLADAEELPPPSEL